MLTDHTYFTGILSIGLSPDTGAPDVTQEAEREKINSYISMYEPEYLHRMLGDKVCARLDAYLQGNGEDSLMKSLNDMLTQRYSPIACYIYFKLLLLGNYHIAAVGAVSASGTDTVSPMRKQIAAWNDMVNVNRRINDLLKNVEGYEPEQCMLEKINEMCI